MKLYFLVFLVLALTGCAGNSEKITTDDDCWNYVRKAAEFRAEGSYQKSLDEIEKHNVCDKSEVRMSYFYHKGWTYYEMGEYERAVEAFTYGLETDPNYFYAYWRRGLAHEAAGDIESAQKDYRKGYDVGVEAHGDKFFEYMSKNLDVKVKLMQDWGA